MDLSRYLLFNRIACRYGKSQLSVITKIKHAVHSRPVGPDGPFFHISSHILRTLHMLQFLFLKDFTCLAQNTFILRICIRRKIVYHYIIRTVLKEYLIISGIYIAGIEYLSLFSGISRSGQLTGTEIYGLVFHTFRLGSELPGNRFKRIRLSLCIVFFRIAFFCAALFRVVFPGILIPVCLFGIVSFIALFRIFPFVAFFGIFSLIILFGIVSFVVFLISPGIILHSPGSHLSFQLSGRHVIVFHHRFHITAVGAGMLIR